MNSTNGNNYGNLTFEKTQEHHLEETNIIGLCSRGAMIQINLIIDLINS